MSNSPFSSGSPPWGPVRASTVLAASPVCLPWCQGCACAPRTSQSRDHRPQQGHTDTRDISQCWGLLLTLNCCCFPLPAVGRRQGEGKQGLPGMPHVPSHRNRAQWHGVVAQCGHQESLCGQGIEGSQGVQDIERGRMELWQDGAPGDLPL